LGPPNWQRCWGSDVVGVPSAASISAVASIPADVAACDAHVASALLLTLLLAILHVLLLYKNILFIHKSLVLASLLLLSSLLWRCSMNFCIFIKSRDRSYLGKYPNL
jgi:hypothetical protein